jgi:vacuolar-type H+-ATPase subunit E/Vma4
MSLERLVEEIRLRPEAGIQEERARVPTETAKVTEGRDRRIAEIRSESKRITELESVRERTQRIASARLAARKLSYEAQERQMADALAQSRGLLKAYTQESEYPAVLKRMYALATDQLGKTVKVYGRPEDAAALKALAGKNFDDRAAPILGGLIAETPDGNRRLNFSFDELLRLREDRLRDLLSR